MRRRAWLRLLILFVVICAFAAVAAVVKGHHGGVRNAIGNLSAPWVFVPFLAGAFVLPRRLALGALVGTASTAAALACYSFVRAAGGGSGTRQLRPDRSEREPMVAHRSNRWRRVGRDWLVARRPRAVDGGYCCRSRSARPRARGTNALGDHAGLPSRDLRAESGRLERGDSLWLCVGNRLPRPTGSVSLTQRSKQPRRPASRIGFRSAQPSPAPTVPRSWTSEHISLPGRPTP